MIIIIKFPKLFMFIPAFHFLPSLNRIIRVSVLRTVNN